MVARSIVATVPDPLPVSVVIPAFNRPAMVARAVRSALEQQPRPPAEVIVVDDASSDDTAAAASAAGARVIRHEVNQGEGAARNTAIRAARHDWVALLDSDDEFLPGHLAALWPHRDGHVILGSSAIAVGPDPADDSLIGRPGWGPEVLSSPGGLLRRGNALVATSVMLRKDVAIAVGLFTEGMERAADLDLWLRMLEHGTGYVSSDITVRYHLHEGQVSGDLVKMCDAHQAVVDAYRDRPWLSRSVGAQSETRLLWDRLRLDLRTGHRRAAFGRLWQIARDPWKARALLPLLAYRLQLQRRRWRYTRTGGQTIRLWTGSPDLVDATARRGLPVVEPLEPRSLLECLPGVLREPAGLTITDSGLRAAIARAAGSSVVRPRRDGAGLPAS
jgi:glycosyltransferase involved in cell wall biosynthesis